MPLAVLTSHGQPSAPRPPEQKLAELAEQVATHLPGWEVRSATLSTPERLEQQVEPGAVIYPFFMAKGWFTADVLPKRLKDIAVTYAEPFGLDPNLPHFTAQALSSAFIHQGWKPEESQILLAAHGSARGPRAANAAQAFAAALRHELPGPQISCGFVEERPTIAEAAKALPPQSFCLPFFAQAGDHVQEDIPEGLTEAAFQGVTLPVIGALSEVPSLIAQTLLRTHRE
ncbi:Sirohydrochlorin ferrochelatase [Epibacterium ulvae]|uniref:Sirohydrochlorin ferrochelatase n=1 Tax=Epibacterium ulvae TaxID=1156985 RepID=A0A1G5PWM0_9RHOB|nr:CbiX/SirB N-terminal domain-containing protein [Epibacterium ulvae]SCZ53923.1 Sirohydrochlorin ferrochelatase [Epibacterium ulvae]